MFRSFAFHAHTHVCALSSQLACWCTQPQEMLVSRYSKAAWPGWGAFVALYVHPAVLNIGPMHTQLQPRTCGVCRSTALSLSTQGPPGEVWR